MGVCCIQEEAPVSEGGGEDLGNVEMDLPEGRVGSEEDLVSEAAGDLVCGEVGLANAEVGLVNAGAVLASEEVGVREQAEGVVDNLGC